MRILFYFVFFLGLSACARRIRDPLLTVEEKCNVQTNYVWLGGKCVRKQSAVVSKTECESRLDGSRWIGETCVSLNELVGLQKECNSRGKGYHWGKDPATGMETCVSTTTPLSPSQECIQNGDLWMDGRCIIPEGIECIRNGKLWTEAGSCISVQEKACIDRLDGSRWIGDRCLSVGEQECQERGFSMRWVPPPTEPAGATGTCTYKKFIDYCKDNDLPAEYAETINVIKSSFQSQTVTCEFIEDFLSNARSLFLSNQNLKNLFPLAFYSGLRILNLSKNKIEDLTPLSNLKNLQRLDLSSNLVSNLVPISELKTLKHLNLSKNVIQDVRPLSGLINLESLLLNDNQITDINVLGAPEVILSGAFKNLRTLNISGNCGITDIRSLDFLDLTFLGLRDVLIPNENIPSKFKDAYTDGNLTVEFSEEGANKCSP